MALKQYLFTLEPIHDVYLDACANVLGMSRSEYIRMLIEEDLEKNRAIVEQYKNQLP